MHSAKYQIDAKICNEHAQDGQNEVNMEEPWIPECLDGLPVERYHIDQQGYESPSLLRVPGPVTAPGYVGPHCSQECAECQQEHSWI